MSDAASRGRPEPVPIHDGTAAGGTAAGGAREIPRAAVDTNVAGGDGQAQRDAVIIPSREWPLWEVFVRPTRGLSHLHVGSLHAADAKMALGNARDLYTRRGEGVSIWVVRSADLVASSPDEKDALFDPAADKVYRHPTFFQASEGIAGL